MKSRRIPSLYLAYFAMVRQPCIKPVRYLCQKKMPNAEPAKLKTQQRTCIYARHLPGYIHTYIHTYIHRCTHARSHVVAWPRQQRHSRRAKPTRHIRAHRHAHANTMTSVQSPPPQKKKLLPSFMQFPQRAGVENRKRTWYSASSRHGN